jgi:hypothetical protein
MFGISPAQTQEAGSILEEISSDWRELVAGSEGFLTSKKYRGLYRQEVVWGEMVLPLPCPDKTTANTHAGQHGEMASCLATTLADQDKGYP